MNGYRLRRVTLWLGMVVLLVGPGVWLWVIINDKDLVVTVVGVWTVAAAVATGIVFPSVLSMGQRQRLDRSSLDRVAQTLASQASEMRRNLLEPGIRLIPLSAHDEHALPSAVQVLLEREASSDRSHAVLLGRGGSGKSVTFNTLAIQMLDQRSRGNTGIRLPVYLPLSQWLAQSSDVREWAARSLSTNGLIPQDFAERLINTGQALLLLDGLDELRSTSGGTSSIERLLSQIHDWEGDTRAPNYILACREDVWTRLPADQVKESKTIAIQPLSSNDIVDALEATRPITNLTTEIGRRLTRRSIPTLRTLSSPWRLQVLLSVASSGSATLPEFRSWLSSRDLPEAAVQRYIVLKLAGRGARSLDAESRAAAYARTPSTRRYKRAVRTLTAIGKYLDRNSNSLREISNKNLPIEDIILHELWPLAGTWLPRIVDFTIAAVVSTPGLIWLNALLFELEGWLPKIAVVLIDAGWIGFMLRTTLTAWVPPRQPGRRFELWTKKFWLQTTAGLIGGIFCTVYFNSVFVAVACGLATWLAIGLTVGFGQTLSLPLNLARVSPDLPLRLERDISLGAAGAAALVVVPGFALIPFWNPLEGGVAGIAYVTLVGFTVASAPYRRYLALIASAHGDLGLRPAKLLKDMQSCGLLRTAGYAYQFRHQELRSFFTH